MAFESGHKMKRKKNINDTTNKKAISNQMRQLADLAYK